MINTLPSTLLTTPGKTSRRHLQTQQPSHEFGSYGSFLETLLEKGYSFRSFPEINSQNGQIALRHDIDFDTTFALRAAEIEAGLGIRSTFFFLMRSAFYNVLSKPDYDNIVRIKELGHTISIHFDPSIYDNIHNGLEWEVRMFRELFGQPVDIISLHRPSPYFQEYDQPILGIEHTYQSKYFKNIKYFADSTGVWRFGHPFDSKEFHQDQTLHVLIHPIWWVVEGDSNLEKLRQYYLQRVDTLKQDFSDNCIPFRKIHAGL